MSLVVYLALVAAAVVALRHGLARALLGVYLPLLLLVPDGFRAITPGLPDPNFSQAAIIPIVLLALARHAGQTDRWKPGAMDALIVAFALCVGYSDYAGRGYADAQNLMFSMLFSVLAPYFVARWVIAAEGLDVAVARRIVILVFGVALVGVWEARFGFNPFHAVIGKLFPGQGTGWVTTFRYGVARVAGPYSHAILAGIVLAMAFTLQRWLQTAGHWEPRFTRLPWPKARVITAVLLVGMVMTVARGPWLGAVAAAVLLAVGQARNRRRALALAGAGLLLGAVAGGWALNDYLDIKPGAVMSMSQESALYRKVLFEKYVDIALAQAWFGWGLTTWPKVRGMASIDNYYLLIALMHGLPAMLMLVLLMLGSALQCIRRGLREPPGSHSPAFAFAGIFIAVFVALGTVYLGEQVLPLLFFVLGWAQGWLRSAKPAAPAGALPARPGPPACAAFRHVIS